MLKEIDSIIEDRYLLALCRFGEKNIDLYQKRCYNEYNHKNLLKDDNYYNFVNWREKFDEVALFTTYAYADLDLPKKFDCIFNYQNPEVYIEIEMILTQSIWEAYIPLDHISHGHKHLVIFNFESNIPEIIYDLYEENEEKISLFQDSLKLGFCLKKDFAKIKSSKVNRLRTK